MSFVTLYATCFTFYIFYYVFLFTSVVAQLHGKQPVCLTIILVLRATFVRALRVHSSMGFKLSSQQQQSSQMQQNLPQNNIQFFWFVYLPGN